MSTIDGEATRVVESSHRSATHSRCWTGRWTRRSVRAAAEDATILADLPPGQAALVSELRALSSRSRVVDVLPVREPADRRCCDEPAPVHVIFTETHGSRVCHWEGHLCRDCALDVIGHAATGHLIVEVRSVGGRWAR